MVFKLFWVRDEYLYVVVFFVIFGWLEVFSGWVRSVRLDGMMVFFIVFDVWVRWWLGF